jgi:hypothetical protein
MGLAGRLSKLGTCARAIYIWPPDAWIVGSSRSQQRVSRALPSPPPPQWINREEKQHGETGRLVFLYSVVCFCIRWHIVMTGVKNRDQPLQ